MRTVLAILTTTLIIGTSAWAQPMFGGGAMGGGGGGGFGMPMDPMGMMSAMMGGGFGAMGGFGGGSAQIPGAFGGAALAQRAPVGVPPAAGTLPGIATAPTASTTGAGGSQTASKASQASDSVLRQASVFRLTPDQTQQLQRVNIETHVEATRAASQIQALDQELELLLRTVPIDLGKVEAKMKEVEGLRIQERMAHLKELAQTYEVLTPEQDTQLYRSLLGAQFGLGAGGGLGSPGVVYGGGYPTPYGSAYGLPYGGGYASPYGTGYNPYSAGYGPYGGVPGTPGLAPLPGTPSPATPGAPGR
jgi:Spy/CpxP family protein refolding chaperone